jgi:hypothetical protein
MTRARKLKKAVRARSRKTGESYAAARRQVLKLRERPAASMAQATERVEPLPSHRPAAPAAGAARGAVSDASIRRKTGRGLEHWFAVLDAFDATAMGHTAAARHLNQVHGVPGWHAQGITVAYERARGIRAANQRIDGKFEVSVSRAVPAPVAVVAGALRDRGRRTTWLAGVDAPLGRALAAAMDGAEAKLVVRGDGRSARLRYRWDAEVVEIYVTAKPKGGSTVVAVSKKLSDAALVDRRRTQWAKALEALKTYLGGGPKR